MPQLGSVELERLVNQGEIKVSDEINFLPDRYSPTVVSGTSEYSLPDYVRSIKRVTWKGYKLDPMPQRVQAALFQGTASSGRPYWYVYNNTGLNRISLFPVPSEALAAGVNLWSTDIATSCIIEFWRISDNVTFRLPDYLRRQLLRYYLAARQHQQEGKRNRFNSSIYYANRFEQEKARFESFIHETKVRPVKRTLAPNPYGRAFPGRPILPIDRFEQ